MEPAWNLSDQAFRRVFRFPEPHKMLVASALQVYVTKQQTAELLHVSCQTVDTWVKAGKLPPPRRIGGKKLFPTRDILRVVEQTAGVRADESRLDALLRVAAAHAPDETTRGWLQNLLQSGESAASGAERKTEPMPG